MTSILPFTRNTVFDTISVIVNVIAVHFVYVGMQWFKMKFFIFLDPSSLKWPELKIMRRGSCRCYLIDFSCCRCKFEKIEDQHAKLYVCPVLSKYLEGKRKGQDQFGLMTCLDFLV